ISNEISSPISILSIFLSYTIESEKLHYNATAQKNSLANKIFKSMKLNKKLKLKKKRQNLKKHATVQAKSQAKKHEALKTRREVIRYNSSGCSSFLLLNPDLRKQMHLCIEFGTATKKRQKEIIKTPPSYGYSALLFANSQNAKQFASAFAFYFVIISQDDKTKVPLGIPAVGRIFIIVQSSHELVAIPGSKQKLIPSVYLTIDPEGLNDSLCNKNSVLNNMLKLKNKFKPILVLLVDDGPDENPRHFKNIKEYSKLFIKLNLDYLTVRTYAPGQSVYNPVECSMSTLLGKLADYIHGKEVIVEYVDEQIDNFNKVSDIPWGWIENHCQISAALLTENNEFLPLSIKDQDATDDCIPSSFSNKVEMLDIFIPYFSDSE
ncbi:19438_t:CDS:2, partial [Cetraspora pellucida]